MTVREWFRVQRGALYERDPQAWKRIGEIATVISEGHNPADGLHWVFTTPYIAMLVGEDRETFIRRQELLERLRLKMDDLTA